MSKTQSRFLFKNISKIHFYSFSSKHFLLQHELDKVCSLRLWLTIISNGSWVDIMASLRLLKGHMSEGQSHWSHKSSICIILQVSWSHYNTSIIMVEWKLMKVLRFIVYIMVYLIQNNVSQFKVRYSDRILILITRLKY